MNVVVDANVVAYHWQRASRTEDAIALRLRTDDWFVPFSGGRGFSIPLAAWHEKDLICR